MSFRIHCQSNLTPDPGQPLDPGWIEPTLYETPGLPQHIANRMNECPYGFAIVVHVESGLTLDRLLDFMPPARQPWSCGDDEVPF